MQKTILVTDDSLFNVELLVSLIQIYCDNKNYPINILTASDGKEAVEICAKTQVDLIFMDYMMPIMDGNEATILIKAKHPEIMIVVVSTFGDEKKQKEMLSNGAEDYITKPIIASLFNSRLHNYIQLLQNRNQINTHLDAHNIINSKVYNYTMNFSISSEEDLTEFWETTLIRFNFQEKMEDIYFLVHFIYSLGTLQLKHKFKFHIIIEESLDSFYFTLSNIRILGCDYISNLIQKYFNGATYLCKEDKLSLSLQKKNSHTEEKEGKKEKSQQEDIIYVSKTDESIQTYDILDEDELISIEDYLVKIKSITLLMENSNLDAQEIDSLSLYFHSLASILASSNDTFIISESLNNLSHAISENTLFFEENSKMLFEFTNAFINDLIFWKTKIFYDGAPSVDFLNDSIQTNANMLQALLQTEESSVEDLDDIFDF